jgi:hypothetical protein
MLEPSVNPGVYAVRPCNDRSSILHRWWRDTRVELAYPRLWASVRFRPPTRTNNVSDLIRKWSAHPESNWLYRVAAGRLSVWPWTHGVQPGNRTLPSRASTECAFQRTPAVRDREPLVNHAHPTVLLRLVLTPSHTPKPCPLCGSLSAHCTVRTCDLFRVEEALYH